MRKSDEQIAREYATTTITYEAQSAPEVVETHTIHGEEVAVVRYARMEPPAKPGDAPVFGHEDGMFAAVRVRGGIEVRPLAVTFYDNDGEFHKAGDRTSYFPLAIAKRGEVARCATIRATLKAAALRIERDQLWARYAPVAEKNIRTHTRAEFDALDPDAEIEPGDLVVVYSHQRYRTGVAIRVTPTKVECIAANPSGGTNGATRKKGEQVRLLRKATQAEQMGAAIRARAERTEPAVEDVAADRAGVADRFADGIAAAKTATEIAQTRTTPDAAAVPAAAAAPAPSEPRTPRGRWAAGLPNDLPPAAVEGLEAAADDFRAAVARAAAREVGEMRRFLDDAGVVSARGMNDDQVRAEYASRTTNRVADVDGRMFGPGALVECAGDEGHVLNGERGRVTAVGDDDQGGQWVRLTWTERRGGMTRSANRVRVIDEGGQDGAPARETMPDGTPVATVAEITAELRAMGVDPDDAEDHECEEAARRVADRVRMVDPHPSPAATYAAAAALDAEEERAAVAGRVFAASQGMGDAVAGCTAYRMVRARVGAAVVRIHGEAGELLGAVSEHADGFRAVTADGRALTNREGGPVFGSFVAVVAAVRFAGRAQTDDQGAAEAAREGEGMTDNEPGRAKPQKSTPAERLAWTAAQGRDPRVDLRGPGIRQYATHEELGRAVGPADERRMASAQPDPAAELLAQAAEQGRRWCDITGQDDGGLAELLALVAKHGIGPHVLRGVADEMLRARAGHVAQVDADGVIVHQGTGVDGYNVPRRMRAESLSWDGGAWQLPGHGSTTEVGERDVAGALAWAAGMIESRTRLLAYGLVPVDQMPHGVAEQHPAPKVTGWEHHRDAYGEWWEPVVR